MAWLFMPPSPEPTARLRTPPFMDPTCCSVCGRWVKRCTCERKEDSPPNAEHNGFDPEAGLLSCLPEELFEAVSCIARCPRLVRSQARQSASAS